MTPNQQQSEAWNGGEAAYYLAHADRIDRQLAPFADTLFEQARIEPRHAVLDVGCGCGVTALAAARQAQSVLGVDISKPLLAVAAERADAAGFSNVAFVEADAQTFEFDPGTFDVIISQFGLMFFDDPVTAFENLRGALAPNGRIVFVCWQELAANEWVMTISRALAEHAEIPTLGGLAGGGGMFALKSDDEVRTLLDTSGFVGIEIEPTSPSMLIGGGGTFDESIDFLVDTGIARGLLGRLDDDARAIAVDAIRADLATRYEPGVGIRLGTGGWLVSARR